MRVQAINNNYYLRNNINNEPIVEDKVLSLRNIPNEENPTFSGLGDYVGKMFGKYYAKPLMEKDWLRNMSETLSKSPGNVTEHMATLGSMITSSVYMTRTLTNKELDPQKRKTLSINQFLCFVIPTICAYTVNHFLAGFNKKLEYRYAGLQEKKKALGQVSGDKLVELNKKLGDRLKGFKTLSALATFTLIYRYVTPVLITPVANKIGEIVNKKSVEKKTNKEQTSLALA